MVLNLEIYANVNVMYSQIKKLQSSTADWCRTITIFVFDDLCGRKCSVQRDEYIIYLITFFLDIFRNSSNCEGNGSSLMMVLMIISGLFASVCLILDFVNADRFLTLKKDFSCS